MHVVDMVIVENLLSPCDLYHMYLIWMYV